MSDYSEHIERAPLVLFLGAGASVPLGKPTTAGFWNELKANPIAQSEEQDLLLELESELATDGNLDIEIILDRLAE